MKILFFACMALLGLASCGSGKDYLDRNNEDKALQDAVKKLNKKPNDSKATEALPVLYASLVKDHLGKINSYKLGKELNRWDKIISEYKDLQQAYESIINSTAAFRLVTPTNFSSELLETKMSAANDYYEYGNSLLAISGRDNARKAYKAFEKTNKYTENYKDASAKMDEAYNNAVINVVINPIQTNNLYNYRLSSSAIGYQSDYFQQELKRDLSNNSERYAAMFYTDWEANRANIKPDWVIDLRIRNIDLGRPNRSYSTRNASNRIQSGTDTSGNPIYQTVTATITTQRISINTRIDMEVTVTDLISGKSLSNNSYRENYNWYQETSNFTGDSRAVTGNERSGMNNNYTPIPNEDELLNELYRKVYPQVLTNIRYTLNW